MLTLYPNSRTEGNKQVLHSKLGFMIITEKRKPLMWHVLFNLSHLTPSEEPTNGHRHTKCCMRRETHQLLLQLIEAKQHLILWEICKCRVIRVAPPPSPISIPPSSRPSSSLFHCITCRVLSSQTPARASSHTMGMLSVGGEDEGGPRPQKSRGGTQEGPRGVSDTLAEVPGALKD